MDLLRRLVELERKILSGDGGGTSFDAVAWRDRHEIFRALAIAQAVEKGLHPMGECRKIIQEVASAILAETNQRGTE